jgi:Asp-tRNA(Asn)/Glu-tRNA(Gln) amidotransferase C subunit
VKAITDELLQSLEVDPRDLAERLAGDLVQRANRTDQARRELVRCGLAADAHPEMLCAAELHHLHLADRELVRLQEEASGILGQLVERADELPADDLRARFHEAEAAQRERIVELRSAFRPRLNLGTASSIRKAAEQLQQLRDLSRLLMRYEVHDERLRLLEGCLAWIAGEWDQPVTTEEEIARGK